MRVLSGSRTKAGFALIYLENLMQSASHGQSALRTVKAAKWKTLLTCHWMDYFADQNLQVPGSGLNLWNCKLYPGFCTLVQHFMISHIPTQYFGNNRHLHNNTFKLLFSLDLFRDTAWKQDLWLTEYTMSKNHPDTCSSSMNQVGFHFL